MRNLLPVLAFGIWSSLAFGDQWFRRNSKLRWAGSGRGKRGGLRVIYYWHPEVA